MSQWDNKNGIMDYGNNIMRCNQNTGVGFIKKNNFFYFKTFLPLLKNFNFTI